MPEYKHRIGFSLEPAKFEILTMWNIGGRFLGRSIAYAATTRTGVVMLFDKAKVGVLIPVPRSLEEAKEIMVGAEEYPVDRAIKSEIRRRLLRGDIIGIRTGRFRDYEPRVPDAILVPFPYTKQVGEALAEKVWEVVETLPLPPVRDLEKEEES